MKRHLLSSFLLYVFAVAATGEVVEINTFVELVKQKNPELLVLKEKNNAVTSGAKAIEIAPPMVALVQQKQDSQTASGFEISQSIPFVTKLSSNLSARSARAEQKVEELKLKSVELQNSAKRLYLLAWSLEQRIKLVDEKASVIADHIKLARSTARSDSFASIHLLKAEADVDALENEKEELRQELREKQIQAANMIGMSAEQFTLETQEPKVSEMVTNVVVEQSHQLVAKKKAVEASEHDVSEAKSDWLPEFIVKYKQMNASSMAPANSEITIGASLPFLFFAKPESKVQVANAEKNASLLEYQKAKLDAQSDIKSMQLRAKSLLRQLEILNTKLIPKAEKRMRLVHNIAPRDLETLQDHRETMEAFPELKMKAVKVRMEYETVIAEIEKYNRVKGE